MKKQNDPDDLKPISIVIIGLNSEDVLKDCIESVINADYPAPLMEIIYVDGGSNDRSVEIAASYPQVKTIELKDVSPTPGKGRNAGYKAAGHSIIQFFDSDTIVHPQWFRYAVPRIKDRIAAVSGLVKEKNPQKNIYHTIADLEWNISSGRGGWRFNEGTADSFGGIVLLRKEAIAEVGGYDASLVAGEDPDLSYRIRRSGWTLYRIRQEMITHDLNMNTFRQYLKRAYRSGHAYAEICLRYIRNKEKFFLRQVARILAGGMFPFFVILLGFITGFETIGVIIAILFSFRALIKFLLIRKKMGIPFSNALLYGFHLSFAVFPQFFGVMRYFYTCLGGKPIRNKGYAPPESGN